MIDVEEATLGSFEDDALTQRQRVVEHEAGVGDGGGVGGVDPREVLVQAGRRDRLVQATRGERGGHALGHRRQGRVVREQFNDVTEADANAVDFVRIGRTDTATGGPDDGVQTVQQPVVTEDDVGTLRDEQPVPADLDRSPRSSLAAPDRGPTGRLPCRPQGRACSLRG